MIRKKVLNGFLVGDNERRQKVVDLWTGGTQSFLILFKIKYTA